MEFHEKLQELRKTRGMTQEDLAQALYVSRTAISKWESGRGYPSIDSLKEISRFFSVTVDELLSTEKLLSIAERENKENLRNIFDMLFGTLDICSVILIVLPLYPNMIKGVIHSVNLFEYTQTTSFNRFVYWVMFILLIIVGGFKLLLTKLINERLNGIVTVVSMVISILLVLLLALTREVYALVVVFLLLVIKGMLLLKNKLLR